MAKEFVKTHKGIEIYYDPEVEYYFTELDDIPFEFLWEASSFINLVVGDTAEHNGTTVRIEYGIAPTEFHLN